jgi:DnaJ-class molecular chaperone
MVRCMPLWFGRMARTFYDVMMVSPQVDRQLLTAVYRHLAKRYHPDKDPSPVAASRMAELNEAYSVLADPSKRARYDEDIGLSSFERGARSTDPADVGDVSAGVFEQGHGEAGPPPVNPEPSGRPLTFGRYRGWTLNQVGRYDHDYLEWLSRTTMGRNYKGELDDLLRKR